MTEESINSKRREPKNGKWKEFNKHAILIAEGHYVNNVKHGIWKEYYDSGELAIVQTYVHGVLNGAYTSYHLNGQLWSEGTHVNGQCEGTFKVYDETGLLVKLLIWENGHLVEEREMKKPSYVPVAVERSEN